MKVLRTSLVLGALFAINANSAQAKDLTVDALHADSSLSGPNLRKARVSPDGSLITILKGREDDARQLDLWAYDTNTGKSSILVSSTELVGEQGELSEEEKNRRERQRIYSSGIIDYDWDSNGQAILFPLGGDVFLYDLPSKKATRVTETEQFETDPKVSPKGQFVSYVRDDELFVYDLSSNKEKQVTGGAKGTIRNATSEFVAQEELGRNTGYWWSNDDQHIAFLQIDEEPVEIAERLDISSDGVRTIRQRYPFAGTDNVTVKLGLTTPKGDKPVWVDLGRNPDIYVGDVAWSKDSSVVYVSRLSRDQKTLDLLAVNPKNGRSKVVLSEKSDTWVNLWNSFYPLSDGGFLWGSERSGFHHLYHYDNKGLLNYAVTKGDWLIDAVECVDEENKLVYFTGWTESPLETHLYSVSMEGGEPTQLSKEEGRHSAAFSDDCALMIKSYHGQSQPLQTAVFDNTGKQLFWLNENDLNKDHPYAAYLDSHVQAEFGQLKAADGTLLDYKLLKPTDIKAGEKRPAIILVYGGPHAQRVHKGWPRGMFEQLLVDQGYVVFQLDNRGAWNRGKKFEDHIYRKMGQLEVEDQAIGAKWLGKKNYVDASKIGVYGWSYGGYMTLMMLAQNPELYAAGVSGAPVSDWALYDTAYTERYMGHPEKDAQAYEDSAVFKYIDNMKGEGELLLIHGMADDNVIFMHAVKVMDELQRAGKTFELMTYPGEKHGFRAKHNRMHRDNAIVDFFNKRLKTKTPE